MPRFVQCCNTHFFLAGGGRIGALLAPDCFLPLEEVLLPPAECFLCCWWWVTLLAAVVLLVLVVVALAVIADDVVVVSSEDSSTKSKGALFAASALGLVPFFYYGSPPLFFAASISGILLAINFSTERRHLLQMSMMNGSAALSSLAVCSSRQNPLKPVVVLYLLHQTTSNTPTCPLLGPLQAHTLARHPRQAPPLQPAATAA